MVVLKKFGLWMCLGAFLIGGKGVISEEVYSFEDVVFLKPIIEKRVEPKTFLSYGFIYYISRYPKLYGGVMALDLLLTPTERGGGELYSYSPGFIYNMFFLESDVGDRGRLGVMAVNTGLMLAGRGAYKWVFSKIGSEKLSGLSESFRPIVSSKYYGACLWKSIK